MNFALLRLGMLAFSAYKMLGGKFLVGVGIGYLIATKMPALFEALKPEEKTETIGEYERRKALPWRP